LPSRHKRLCQWFDVGLRALRWRLGWNGFALFRVLYKPYETLDPSAKLVPRQGIIPM